MEELHLILRTIQHSSQPLSTLGQGHDASQFIQSLRYQAWQSIALKYIGMYLYTLLFLSGKIKATSKHRGLVLLCNLCLIKKKEKSKQVVKIMSVLSSKLLYPSKGMLLKLLMCSFQNILVIQILIHCYADFHNPKTSTK